MQDVLPSIKEQEYYMQMIVWVLSYSSHIFEKIVSYLHNTFTSLASPSLDLLVLDCWYFSTLHILSDFQSSSK